MISFFIGCKIKICGKSILAYRNEQTKYDECGKWVMDGDKWGWVGSEPKPEFILRANQY